ncbi:MAG: S66 peptidase family protein [Acetatifactor sp.]
MRYPKNLTEGGAVGFAAPSFGCATEPYRSAFDNALKKWQNMGYKTILGPNCYATEGVGICNSPKNCAEEIMEMYCNEDTEVLISCGGGELMCEILPMIDFDRLKEATPKWFMGYSDNTNLTFTLATLTDTASVYGPCAASFGMEPWHSSLEDALGILTGKVRKVAGYGMWESESLKDETHPLMPYHLTESLNIRTFMGRQERSDEWNPENPLTFSGRLLGGCLDCLVTLCGTCFDRTVEFIERYREDGIIWFLEACDLNVFAIRRAMWQLEQAGWFKHAKGFLIGRPGNGQPMFQLDAYEAVLEVAGRKNVPVIMDVDLGHRPPMMPLIVGSVARVSVAGNTIELQMECR